MLSVVMVLSMSVSVFAADNSANGIPVTINNGTQVYTETITTDDFASYVTSVGKDTNHLFTVKEGVSIAAAPNAADALIAGWLKANENDTYTDIEIASDWDTTSSPAGLYFTLFDSLGTTGHYVFVGMTPEGKYEYYWTGTSWTLYVTIGGVKSLANFYASSYPVSELDAVEFDYVTSDSDHFTSDVPLNLN